MSEWLEIKSKPKLSNGNVGIEAWEISIKIRWKGWIWMSISENNILWIWIGGGIRKTEAILLDTITD